MALEQNQVQEPDVSQTKILLGFLTPPVLWAAFHSINYALVSLSCSRGWLQDNLFGLSALRVVVLLLTLIFAAAIVISGTNAHRNWRRFRRRDGVDDRYPEERRTQFMAYAGLVLAVLFGVATLTTGIPAVFLQVCPEIFGP